ncbi:NADH dehydrogenase, subunit H (ubiquinone) [Natrialba asiatica DSM 12278]|uniref:NADH dehydrogenase, subunit H (Ubiquinone) n=1 Tax=Natrialba asiatica (strain ATCC 700177 / DSM 12278 / JCM 9576 / FERM P-10747 / NBRC 102637 / 172P1) TaxID=29540 RepID=M0B209_NATA1|nr:NADH dehydrogenase, subunit H (ubiquinone) [Natrialba asiatica DSM 12278]
MRLVEAIAELLGFGPNVTILEQLTASLLGAIFIGIFCLIHMAITGPWAKRKVNAAFADRIAVNRVGPFGLFVIVADIVRLISKELIIPDGVDRSAWDFAPILLFFSACVGFAVVPMETVAGVTIQLADPETGVVFLFAISSLASLALVIAGYSSNNKYSFLGGLRAVAQNIAYEIPLVVTAASVVLFTGTLRVSEVVAFQSRTFTDVLGVHIPSWFAFVNPFAFALFVAANLAEIGRNPFDTPEAPQEVVAGYQTEYSSVYFVFLYGSEFLHIFLGGAIIAILFLGGRTDRGCQGSFGSSSKYGAFSCSRSGHGRQYRASESTNSSKSAGKACSSFLS